MDVEDLRVRAPVPARRLEAISLQPTSGRVHSAAYTLTGSRGPLSGVATSPSPIQPSWLRRVSGRDSGPVESLLARLRSPSSRTTVHFCLKAAAKILTPRTEPEDVEWWSLSYADTGRLREALMGRYKLASANAILSAVRGVLRECLRLGFITADYHASVREGLGGIPGRKFPAGRALDIAEIVGLLEGIAALQPTDDPLAPRDLGYLAISYGAGLRCAEAVRLDIADYNEKTQTIRVIEGKGGKDRTAYVVAAARPYVAKWLEVREPGPGPFVYATDYMGRNSGRPLDDSTARGICRDRALQFGLAHFSPHDLRRSFGSHLDEALVPLGAIRDLMGHSNIATTSRYLRSRESVLIEAAGRVRAP